MAGNHRWTPRTYTLEEKIALVTEIDRRYRSGDGSLRAIATALGTTETSYCNWVEAGIKPSPAPGSHTLRIYSPAEREQVVAEVTRLRGEGQSLRSACHAAGVSDNSFRRWRADTAPPSAMRAVEVTALVPVAPAAQSLATPRSASAIETLSLIAPGGYRLEGLGIESAVALLRALA